MTTTTALSGRLREARHDAGLTQTEVAERVNMSQGNLSDYERGDAVPQLARLTDLADLYGVSLDWLAGRD